MSTRESQRCGEMYSFQSQPSRLELLWGLFNWYLCREQHTDIHLGNNVCQSLCNNVPLSLGMRHSTLNVHTGFCSLCSGSNDVFPSKFLSSSCSQSAQHKEDFAVSQGSEVALSQYLDAACIYLSTGCIAKTWSHLHACTMSVESAGFQRFRKLLLFS